MTKILPKRLDNILNSSISPGNRHAWLLKMAGFLVARFPDEKAHDLLNKMAEIIGKPESQFNGETQNILKYLADKRDTGSTRIEQPVPLCDKDEALRASILQSYKPLFDQTTKSSASEAILSLFRENEVICYGSDLYNPLSAAPIALAPYAASMQYIVSNPVSDAEGIENEKGVVIRCQDNIDYRKYLVVEFDDPALSKIDQATLLSALDRILQLVLVVDSGGKSLHGWFDVQSVQESKVRNFFRLAIKLGADRNMWNKGSWVRMPGGKRYKDGSQAIEQKILFLRRQTL